MLSNRNNWSRRSIEGNKGTSVCRRQEGSSAVLCSLLQPLSCCNTQKHRAVFHTYTPVRVCEGAREDSTAAFLPAYLHTDVQVIIRY